MLHDLTHAGALISFQLGASEKCRAKISNLFSIDSSGPGHTLYHEFYDILLGLDMILVREPG